MNDIGSKIRELRIAENISEMLAYRLDEMAEYFREDERFAKLRKRLGEQHIVI